MLHFSVSDTKARTFLYSHRHENEAHDIVALAGNLERLSRSKKLSPIPQIEYEKCWETLRCDVKREVDN